MRSTVIFLVLFVFFLKGTYGQSALSNSILHKQKAVCEIVGESLNEYLNDVANMRNSAGVIHLTLDSLVFKCKDRNVPERYNFALSVCEILSIDKHLFGGFIPNRIRITTRNKIYQLATFKRKKLILQTRQQMEKCKKVAMP